MTEISFDNEHYYRDDGEHLYNKEKKDNKAINEYLNLHKIETFAEKRYKEQWSFTDREDVIVMDEFGRTDAPNVLIDNYKYIEEELPSIFRIQESQSRGGKSIYDENGVHRITPRLLKGRGINYWMSNIHPNPLLQIQIKKDVTKNRILEHLVRGTKNILKENKDITKGLHLRLLQECALIYLRFNQTPIYETLKDWNEYKKREDRKKYIDVMFEIIEKYVSRIKTTWEI